MADEISMLATVDIGIAEGPEAVVVRVPMGTDAFVEAHGMKIVEERVQKPSFGCWRA